MRSRSADLGLLIVRLALGLIFIAHGSQKLLGAFGGKGFPGVEGMVSHMGFSPPWLWAGLLTAAEFGGGILLVAGFLTRFAAAAIVIDMGVAIAKVHRPKGFFIPGYEYNLALIAIALALIVAGAGMFSVDWNLRPRKVEAPPVSQK